MKKRVYISGKVTGEPIIDTMRKFRKAANKLEKKGFVPINPMNLVRGKDVSWEEAMKTCIAALVVCDGIHVLPDAIKSKGALLEIQIAASLKIEIITL